MKTDSRWLMLASGVLASAVVSQDIPPLVSGVEPSRYDTAIEMSQRIVMTLREETSLPGMSIAVNLDGRTVWQQGFGYANLEQQAPARAETRFRFASISKAITGVAVASLEADGLLDLDQPIEEVLSDCPEEWSGITVRMLMGHTAGIRSYTALERDDLSPKQRDTVEEALEMFRDDPLVHDPGARFTYTTLGYIVVRAIIEEVTGQDFMAVVTERVFIPAGMESTGADRVLGVTPSRSSVYHFIDGENGISDARLTNAPHTNLSYKPAGGGMNGTAADLARLGHGLAEDSVISRSARDSLWTPTVSNSGEVYEYGLGWGLAEDTEGVFYGVQIGGQIGAGSAVIVYPEDDVSVAMLSNRAAGPVARSETVPIARLFRDARDGVRVEYPDDLPIGFFDISVLDQHGREYAGRMTISTHRGLPAGEFLVRALDREDEYRRFRIATARQEPGDTGAIRFYAVHQDWGLFPFVLRFAEDGSIEGRLDRQVEQWEITGQRRDVPGIRVNSE
ncbi:MAG: serine hydrolase domain-containing protein [Planctomycetota bacterium]